MQLLQQIEHGKTIKQIAVNLTRDLHTIGRYENTEISIRAQLGKHERLIEAETFNSNSTYRREQENAFQ